MKKIVFAFIVFGLGSSAFAQFFPEFTSKEISSTSNVHLLQYQNPEKWREVYALNSNETARYGVWCESSEVSGIYLSVPGPMKSGLIDIPVKVERQSKYQTDSTVMRFRSDGKNPYFADDGDNGHLYARYMFDSRSITFTIGSNIYKFGSGAIYGEILRANCK